MRYRRPPWPDLPQELLTHVFDSLRNDVAFLQCSLVCSAWRSAAAWARRRFSPLLFVASRHALSRADLLDAPTRDSIAIALPDRVRVSGPTGRGWLITVGIDPPNRIELLNPVSGARVALPQIDHGLVVGPVQHSVGRAAISADPVEPGCLVVLIYRSGLKLGFCRPDRDENWTELVTSPEICFSDVMFHAGRFYVTDKKGTILECELDGFGFDPRLAVVAASVDGGFSEKFMASSSSGEFLVAVRTPRFEGLYDGDEDDDDDEEFKVFGLDLGTGEWSKVESLGSDDLFLARNGSVCVSSSEGFGGNRVCFLNCSSWWCIELEIYDLEKKKKKKTEKVRDREAVARAGNVCWIVPELV